MASFLFRKFYLYFCIPIKEWIVESNTKALQQYVTEKGVAFLLNPALSSKLLDVAVSIPTIQMELQNNPI
ncbi:unnamed protein product, partial [Mesorhabditis spiculigera]